MTPWDARCTLFSVYRFTMYRILIATILAVLIPSLACAESLLETGKYFEGTWTCTTERGSFAIHNYRIELGDRWMTMHNRFEMPSGATGLFDEYYRYNALTQAWDVVVFGSDGTLATGTSPPWYSVPWVFVGEVSSGNTKWPWRMTYTKITAAKFARIHEVQVDGGWRQNSGETCEKRS